jgi:hypothetical protein
MKKARTEFRYCCKTDYIYRASSRVCPSSLGVALIANDRAALAIELNNIIGPFLISAFVVLPMYLIVWPSLFEGILRVLFN